MHSFAKYAGILVLLISPLYLICQLQSLDVQKLDFDAIASMGVVTNIHSDSKGFLWIGSYSGLYKYDGYSLKHYMHDPADITTISDNKITSMAEDSRGNFWIGTQEGLNYFDAKTNSFHHYNDPKVNGLSNEIVGALYIDEKDDLLVAVDKYLMKLGRNQLKIDTLFSVSAWEFSEDYIMIIDKISNDNLFIGATSGTSIYDLQTKEHYNLSDHNVTCQSYFRTGTDKLIFGTKDGLHMFDLHSKFISRLNDTEGHRIYSLIAVNENELLFSADSSLLHYNLDSDHLSQVRVSGEGSKIGKGGFYDNLHISDGGLLWFGKYIGGIFFTDISNKRFRNLEEVVPLKIIDNVIELFQIHEYRPNQLIYSDGSSAFLYDWVQKEKQIFPKPPLLDDLSNNYRFTSFLDEGDALWVGTFNGILKFDKKLYQYVSCIDESNLLRILPNERIRHVHRSAQTGDLIVATWWNGIRRINTVTGEITSYLHNLEDFCIQCSNTRTIYETSDSTLWVGTRGGLIEFEKNLDTFHLYQKDINQVSSLSDNTIFDMIEDRDQNLWLGTYGGGLNKLDRSTGQFSHVTVGDGLLNNNVFSTLMDENYNLWLLTYKGLTRLDLEEMSFETFTYQNGLNSTAYDAFLFGQSTNSGNIYIGGNKGIDVFHPDSIQPRSFEPNVMFTDFKLANKTVAVGQSNNFVAGFSLDTTITFVRDLKLTYRDRVISFEYTALDLLNPQNIEYAYMLEGFDTDWQYVGSRRQATYTNLDPGTYTLKVKATNSDKIWSTQQASMKITISPPWWATWWAYLGYIIVVAGMIYWLYNPILRRRLLQEESKRIKQLDAFKTQFYINITHEFRTPITVISGIADQIATNPADWITKGPEIIKRNAVSLLNLVNQILHLRKLETDHLSVDLVKDDIIGFIRYTIEPFITIAANKNVTLSLRQNIDELVMDHDQEKINVIVTNLISNAIKFTDPGGEILLALLLGVKNDCPILNISVTDTGRGIHQDHMPFIFDRFYQIDHVDINEMQGSGIGLSLSKELITLLNGDISVTSELGQGSTFTIQLPIEDDPTIQSMSSFYLKETPKAITLSESQLGSEIKKENSNLDTVLVIEDNYDVHTYIHSCISNNYNVLQALDGQQGIELALETIPDLIISDVMMPDVDGYQVCSTLKSDIRTNHIPIILLTAKADIESKLEGLTYGADNYLYKPFDKQELLLRLKNLIKIRKSLQIKYTSVARSSSAVRKDPQQRFLEKIKSNIERKMSDESFTIHSLCGELGMSRAQLHNKLKAITGLSTSIYIRQIRLEKAKSLLAETDKNISEIAYVVGFKDPSFFSQAFKKVFGISPRDFRKSPDQ